MFDPKYVEQVHYWNILGFTNLKSMPALKWKLQNIHKMDRQKRIEQSEILQTLLDQS